MRSIKKQRQGLHVKIVDIRLAPIQKSSGSAPGIAFLVILMAQAHAGMRYGH